MQPFTFFISYRREHTAPIALLLKDELEKRLQFVRVSVDVGDGLPQPYKTVDRSGTRYHRAHRQELDASTQ